MGKITPVNVERRRQRMALSLFASVFLVLVGSFAFFHIKNARGIGKHLQMLKAAGEPVTLEEITREYKSLKAEENGAAAYSNAFNLMTNVALLGARKTTEIKVEATKLLDGNRETFEQVHQENGAFYEVMEQGTAKFRRTTYPLEFEKGFSMLLKHLKEREDAFKLIELDALFAAERRDADKLMRDLEMMLTLGNSVEREPIMISVLVRLRAITMAARITQLIVQCGEVSEAQFRKVRTLWEFAPVREHFVKSLWSERWVIRDLFGRPSSYFWPVMQSDDSPGANIGLQLLRMSGAAKVDALNHLEKVWELQTLFSQRASLTQHLALEQMLAETKIDKFSGISDIKLVSRAFLPGVYKAGDRVIRGEATLQLVNLGLSVAEYVRMHDKFPEKLGDVDGSNNGEGRVDPFTGSEFMYIVEEDGAVIYSVGANWVDERGVTFEKAKVDDFGFHVWRVN